MDIISWEFLLFITITLVVYYLLNHKAQNYWLLFTSVFFIFSWGWLNLIPLILIAGNTFLTGKKITQANKKGWLVTGISFNILFFALLRILGSPFFNIQNQVMFSDNPGIMKQLLIPLGFSFYVLQAISYLIDIYKTKIQAETNAIHFLLYLVYFPKFLAGPIERAEKFLPQLTQKRIVDNHEFSNGLGLIILGLFRKIVIAEILLSALPTGYLHAPIINTHPTWGIFSLPFFSYQESMPYANRLAGILGYGIYLYNDFAGYTGIVRGISLLIGINLSSNFMVPYYSSSLSDFWSRWHISLSSWLRDYIYFPLTRYLKRNAIGKHYAIPLIFPLIATMLFSGLWHGMTLPLLIWGGVYGIIMVLEQFIFQKWSTLRPQNRPMLFTLVSTFFTFIVVTLAWVPFTAVNIGEIFAFWKVIFKLSGWNLVPDFSFWIIVLVFVSFLMDYLQLRYKDEIFFLKWPLLGRAPFLATLIILLGLASTWSSQYASNVFIYQGF